MADIISHLTDSENILMYVDSVEKKPTEYVIKGWVFAADYSKVTNLGLKDGNSTCKFHERKDVVDFYPNLKETNIGFELTLYKTDIFKNVIVSTESIEGTVGSSYEILSLMVLMF